MSNLTDSFELMQSFAGRCVYFRTWPRGPWRSKQNMILFADTPGVPQEAAIFWTGVVAESSAGVVIDLGPIDDHRQQ